MANDKKTIYVSPKCLTRMKITLIQQKKLRLECSRNVIIQDKAAGIVIMLAQKYCIWSKNTSYSFSHHVQVTPVSPPVGLKHLFSTFVSITRFGAYKRKLHQNPLLSDQSSFGGFNRRNAFSNRNVTVAALIDTA